MRNEGVLKKIGVGYVKMHSGFENGDMPTKVLISQLLHILAYYLNTKLKLRHRPIIPMLHMQII